MLRPSLSMINNLPRPERRSHSARGAAKPQSLALTMISRGKAEPYRTEGSKAAETYSLSLSTRSVAANTLSTGTRLMHSGCSNFSQK